MPIYEYRCHECGTISDYLLPIGENKPKLVCTHCGSTRLDKQISTPNLIKKSTNVPGVTCCGREERCQKPPCTTFEGCQRQ